MKLPEIAQNIVVALYSRNKSLAEGSDDQRRVLTKMIVEQLTYSDTTRKWGHKAEKGGPPSKDTIGFSYENKNIAFDLFDGNTRAPNNFPFSEKSHGLTPKHDDNSRHSPSFQL